MDSFFFLSKPEQTSKIISTKWSSYLPDHIMDLIIIGGKSSFFIFQGISFFLQAFFAFETFRQWFLVWANFHQASQIYTARYVICMLSCSVVSDSCDSMNCNLPDSPVCGVFQARILEWVAISFSRDLSDPWTLISWVSCIGRQILTNEPPGQSHTICSIS